MLHSLGEVTSLKLSNGMNPAVGMGGGGGVKSAEYKNFWEDTISETIVSAAKESRKKTAKYWTISSEF